jgi:hypothetical protein
LKRRRRSTAVTTIKLKSITDTEHFIFDTEVQCVAYHRHWEEQIRLARRAELRNSWCVVASEGFESFFNAFDESHCSGDAIGFEFDITGWAAPWNFDQPFVANLDNRSNSKVAVGNKSVVNDPTHG